MSPHFTGGGYYGNFCVANQFSEMAKELPASGSFYTFVAQGLGPRMGFITGWLTLISYGIVSPFAPQHQSHFAPFLYSS